MRVRTSFKILFLAIAGLGAALVAMVVSIDTEQVRWLIIRQVEATTGRALDIRGKIGVKLSLTPSIVLNDVTLSNAAWGSRPEMARARRVEAQIALQPLFSSKIEFSRLVLIEPDILFERNAKGQTNWNFGPPTQGEPTTALHVGRFAVDGGTVTYRDPVQEHTIGLASLTMLAKHDGGMAVDAETTYAGHAIKIAGELGALAQIQRQTRPFPIDLSVKIDRAQGRISGTVGDLNRLAKLDFSVELEFPETNEALSWAGVPLASSLGPALVHFTLGDAKGRLQATDIEATIGSQDGLLISAEGRIDDLLRGDGISLRSSAELADLSLLSDLFGEALPALGPITAHFTLSRPGPKEWLFEGLRGHVGQTELAGEARLTLAEQTAVKASLATLALDLADFLPKSPGQKTEDGRIIPDDILPTEWMKAIDLELDLKAGRVVLPHLDARDFIGRFRVRGGKASAAPVSFGLANGRVSGRLEIDANQAPPAIVLQVTGESLGLGLLLREWGITDQVREGATDLSLYLRGPGHSPREFAATANGRLRLQVGNAVLAGAHADLMAINIISQLLPWGGNTRDTEMRCLIGDLDIRKGQAETETLLFDTTRMSVIGGGRIDLASERIDFTLVPSPKDDSLISLATPVIVDGTLGNPSLSPSALGLARGLAGVVGDIAFSPFNLLALFAGGGDDKACTDAAETLKARAWTRRPPKEEPQ
jgi:uncharacterized protein involved in outer membrane biogenesis